jgi:hypothetical protein
MCDDPIQDRCVTGLALATGWHAGKQLARYLEQQTAAHPPEEKTAR